MFGWVAASPCPTGARTPASSRTRSTSLRTVRGQGIGLKLLTALIHSTESAGVWTIQSGIFPENHASLRLHEQAGFRVVGTRQSGSGG